MSFDFTLKIQLSFRARKIEARLYIKVKKQIFFWNIFEHFQPSDVLMTNECVPEYWNKILISKKLLILCRNYVPEFSPVQ